MTTPSVSVIIPVYNRAAYVAETISSVLSQTYSDLELIVVDDGSSDGSRKVIETFGDRVQLLEHPGQENRGQSAAINLGLKHARGRYIGILDSDDLWLPRKLEIQVWYLDAHPEVGLVYGNGWRVDSRGRRIGCFYDADHVEESNPSAVLLDCYFLLPNNALVRRTAIDKAGGFDEKRRSAQDNDMAVRVAEVARIAYVA